MTAVFGTAANKYVLTYVHDTDGTGNLILPQSGVPTSTTVGFRMSDLQTQMNRALPVNLVHGAVTASTVLSVVFKNYNGTSSTVSYTIPAAIPTGAIGLISSGQ
jgi:hypothetical protein